VNEPREVVSLTDPVALRAYAHPLRMSLVGLLRREGPLTATQAAERLGESVPNCSFHLRQLAKYGLVERVEGADAREKPWRASALMTSWGAESDDPEILAAVSQLDGVIARRYYEKAVAWLAHRAEEPAEWRRVTGFGDALLWVTAEELGEIQQRMDELVAAYRPRQTDPSLRPPGHRAVTIVQYVYPLDGEAQ
jgi:predicted ArsR family transcriptional regulator